MAANPTRNTAIYPDMKIFLYTLFAFVLAAPFAKPADAQVVIAVGHHHHHHRHYHHHHHHYR